MYREWRAKLDLHKEMRRDHERGEGIRALARKFRSRDGRGGVACSDNGEYRETLARQGLVPSSSLLRRAATLDFSDPLPR
jgi:hypothetical protein